MDRYEHHLNAATETFNNGFTSKAAKKRTTDHLNRAYDIIEDVLRDKILAMRNGVDDKEEARLSDLYWAIPKLYQWREKHNTIFAEFPDFIEKVAVLDGLRQATKDAEITPIIKEVSEADNKVEAVRKSITEEMERLNKQYIEGLGLAEHFGGLHVSVNAHFVTNAHGTMFLRHFFYLNGKLTALNMIIAIAQGFKDKQGKTK